MIKKLKVKFIATAMFSVLAVFLVLLIGINMFFTHNMTTTSDSLLKVLVNEDINTEKQSIKDFSNSNPDGEKRPPEMDMKQDPNNILGFVPETRNSMRYFIVIFDAQGNVVQTNTDHIVSITEQEAIEMAQQADKTKTDTIKWYDDYRYVCSQTANGLRVVFLNCEMVKYSLQALRMNSALIAAASYALTFLIVLLFSNKAIKPIADSYQKQKQFITDASHELKTPLTIISANNELQEINSGRNECSQAINDEVEHMTHLVNQLVLLSRYDEEKLQVVSNNFNLSDAIAETAMAFTSVIERSHKKLNVDICPDLNFNGDEEMIRRLTSILMDNAVKYCDENGEISVKLTQSRHIDLIVSNTYKNVDNINLELVFDRFYREDKARTRGSGYGLGLSIARAIVNSHHGSIKAVNVDHNSISFCVSL